MKTLVLFWQSRKAWAAAFALLGIGIATYLRAANLIPPETFLPIALGISGIGATFIGGTAVEDSAKHLGARTPPRTTQSVLVVPPEPSPNDTSHHAS